MHRVTRSVWSASVFRRFRFLQLKSIQSAGIRRTPNASRVSVTLLHSAGSYLVPALPRCSAMFQNSSFWAKILFALFSLYCWCLSGQNSFSFLRALFHFSSPFAPFARVEISVLTLCRWSPFCWGGPHEKELFGRRTASNYELHLS